MKALIEAVLFDMGGILRRCIEHDEASRVVYLQKILDLIGSDMPIPEFGQLLAARAKAYHKWAKATLEELDEARLWTEWMLPDLPAAKIAPLAVELNMAWRDVRGIYRMIPGAHQTVLGLYRRGYRLGLVSNTTSSVDVPRMLEGEKLSGCFDAVVLSCLVGKRKPGAAILHEAVQRMGVRPDNCAYIGNLPERDVAAARAAGFARAVILRDPQHPFKKPVTPQTQPDHFIDDLTELLDLFPKASLRSAPAQPRYNLSLSTMWGMKKFDDLGDFLLAVPRLGLAGVELNHQVTPGMLAGLGLEHTRISSVHEPCPADPSADHMKKQDLLISSPDPERRRQGVLSIQRSIDLAARLGAHTVVVHPGQVQADGTLESELRTLYKVGQAGSAEFAETRVRLAALRAALVPPYLEAVKQSLKELLDYAAPLNIRLGLENRYHVLDLPSLDEMGELLALAGPDRLGMLYDTGHAQTLDRLGFYPHEEWLRRYAGRIIGVHLHDVVGVDDHRAPGLGEVDFRMVGAYLPAQAARVLEIQSTNTVEQVKAGLKLLVDTGCVSLI
jgi:FMN phosphatase YigB (HAD superfamily)/sugar phosphate isomerase/epimerase